MEHPLVTSGFPQAITHPSTNKACGFSDELPHATTVANRDSPLGEIQVGMWLLLLLSCSTRDELWHLQVVT